MPPLPLAVAEAFSGSNRPKQGISEISESISKGNRDTKKVTFLASSALCDHQGKKEFKISTHAKTQSVLYGPICAAQSVFVVFCSQVVFEVAKYIRM